MDSPVTGPAFSRDAIELDWEGVERPLGRVLKLLGLLAEDLISLGLRRLLFTICESSLRRITLVYFQ